MAGKAAYVRQALAALVDEDYVLVEMGHHNSKQHRLVKPYPAPEEGLWRSLLVRASLLVPPRPGRTPRVLVPSLIGTDAQDTREPPPARPRLPLVPTSPPLDLSALLTAGHLEEVEPGSFRHPTALRLVRLPARDLLAFRHHADPAAVARASDDASIIIAGARA